MHFNVSNQEKTRGNVKSMGDIAKLPNIKMNNIDDELDDLNVDEYEILSDEKTLTMDEIKEIVDDNISDMKKCKITDILEIV